MHSDTYKKKHTNQRAFSKHRISAGANFPHTYVLGPVDAYVACGGKPDKSGHVHRDTLVKIIKKDFGLPINIEVSAAANVVISKLDLAWFCLSS